MCSIGPCEQRSASHEENPLEEKCFILKFTEMTEMWEMCFLDIRKTWEFLFAKSSHYYITTYNRLLKLCGSQDVFSTLIFFSKSANQALLTAILHIALQYLSTEIMLARELPQVTWCQHCGLAGLTIILGGSQVRVKVQQMLYLSLWLTTDHEEQIQ